MVINLETVESLIGVLVKHFLNQVYQVIRDRPQNFIQFFSVLIFYRTRLQSLNISVVEFLGKDLLFEVDAAGTVERYEAEDESM